MIKTTAAALGGTVVVLAAGLGNALGWFLAPIEIPWTFAVLLLFIPADKFQSVLDNAVQLMEIKLLNRIEKAETEYTDDETKAKPP